MKNVYKTSDVDPTNPVNIICFYTGVSRFWDFSSFSGNINREHVWPDSRGVGTTGPGADPHMIRPSYVSDNSARGNSFFAETGAWDPGTGVTGAQLKYRGIAARIILFMAVRYKTQSGLNLVDLYTDNTANKSMGKLSDLLKWNFEYSVDASEIQRNNAVFAYQGNRNPFIDNPEYGCKIWGNTNATTKAICGM